MMWGGGEQIAIPLNLNAKNILNADFSGYFKFMYIFFDKMRVNCN